jgi:hypothetical protein
VSAICSISLRGSTFDPGLNPDGCEFLLVFDDGEFEEADIFASPIGSSAADEAPTVDGLARTNFQS